MGRGIDPGECPICGAAHSSCGGGPIEVVLLPNRDAMARPNTRLVSEPETAVVVPPALGDGSDGRPFSTATYRGDPKKRKR